MSITFEFACRDDCLDKMTPSDLRRLVTERDRLAAENKRLLELLTCVETNLSKGMSKSIQRLQAREIRAALKEKS